MLLTFECFEIKIAKVTINLEGAVRFYFAKGAMIYLVMISCVIINFSAKDEKKNKDMFSLTRTFDACY